MLEAHLRRAEHMAGRMQAQAHAEMVDRARRRQRLQVDLAEPRPQDALGRRRRQVAAMAAARMVGMGMGQDGARDRPPGVDVEVSGRAVEAFGPLHHEIGRAAAHAVMVAGDAAQ